MVACFSVEDIIEEICSVSDDDEVEEETYLAESTLERPEET